MVSLLSPVNILNKVNITVNTNLGIKMDNLKNIVHLKMVKNKEKKKNGMKMVDFYRNVLMQTVNKIKKPNIGIKIIVLNKNVFI